jgi:hypothetical protein
MAEQVAEIDSSSVIDVDHVEEALKQALNI